MRIFEIILILVNFLSLLLSVKKQSKAVWLGTAGVNLSVLLIHCIFEGFRYQMFFSYIFVILFVVVTLVKVTSNKIYEAKTPKALKFIITSLSFLFLASASFLAYALPVFKLANPTGSYAVGIQYYHLVDEKRNDPFLNKSTKKRELAVKIYYPATQNDSQPFERYFHNDPKLIRGFTAFYSGLPAFLFDHLNLVKTNSKAGLEMSRQQSNYPVILFSHGAGTSMEVHTSQCEDLASHGYIVAAIDHTYVSSATEFPDRIVSSSEATTNFNVGDPAEVITQIMAEDASFVIDKLDEMNQGKMDSILKGSVDMGRIGVIGHSVGGAVAYNLAINDSRVKAAVNLDGKVYVTPKGGTASMAPLLMLANDKYHIQSIQNRESLLVKFEDLSKDDQDIMISMYGSKEAYNEAYQKSIQAALGLSEVLKVSGNLYTIEGSDHMKFTDIGLFFGISQLRELIGIGGKTDPVKCLSITEAVTTAFFDQHLKGGNKDSVESLIVKYLELKKVDIR